MPNLLPRLRTQLITTTMLALITLQLACDDKADDSAVTPEPGDGAVEDDGGVEAPFVDQVIAGCTASDARLDVLPEVVVGLSASPADIAERSSGTWTNEDGDMLMIELASSGRLHLVEGTPSNTGTATGPCNSATYVSVAATITLQTDDGRFDEVFEGEWRTFGPGALLKANVPLDTLSGTFEATMPNDGLVRWSAGYARDGAASWQLEGAVEPAGRVIELPWFRTVER